MKHDRNYNALYYDASTTHTEDVNFYCGFVDANKSVLELGCGTGRVTLSILDGAQDTIGVDVSSAMLERARQKLGSQKDPFVRGDITKLELGRRFDLIIAPFRVIQALETDELVDGLFEVIKTHLAPSGTAILNVFNPNQKPDDMAHKWPHPDEIPCGELTLDNGDLLVMSDERKHLDAERQVLYPVLIYRRYRNGELIDEHRNPICMRYYYPDQFTALIERHGFTILNTWGGYNNEPYGQGPELVVAFQ